MTNRLTISEDMMNDCKCNICGCFLSVAPIRIIDNELVCGRCKGDSIRIKAYEAVAKHLQFPCRYKHHGCIIYLGWNVVYEHEKICNFKPIVCGKLGCEWNGPKQMLSQHFESTHPKLIISDDTIININLKQHICLLLLTDNLECKVQLVIDHNVFKHNVTLITNRGVYTEGSTYTCHITFANGINSLTYRHQNVNRYESSCYTKLDLVKLRAVFEDPSSLNFSICVDATQPNNNSSYKNKLQRINW